MFCTLLLYSLTYHTETYIAEGGEFEVDQLDLATTDSSGGLTSGGTSGSSAAYRSSRFRRESPPSMHTPMSPSPLSLSLSLPLPLIFF